MTAKIVNITGGYGVWQYRQAQNASDLAAQSASYALQSACIDGSTTVTESDIQSLLQDVISLNDPSGANGWKAEFVNEQGAVISDPNLPSGVMLPPSQATYSGIVPTGNTALLVLGQSIYKVFPITCGFSPFS